MARPEDPRPSSVDPHIGRAIDGYAAGVPPDLIVVVVLPRGDVELWGEEDPLFVRAPMA
jgi:hypothetical protein